MPGEIEIPDGASPADYQSAALKAFDSLPNPPAEKEEPPPKEEPVVSAEGEGEEPGDPPKEKEPAAKEEPPKEKEPEGAELVALAKKDAELRKRERALKEQEKASADRLSKAETMLRAMESGDAVGFLAAGGFNYRQVVEAVVKGQQGKNPAAKQQPAAENQTAEQLKPLLEKVSKLESQLQQFQEQEFNTKILTNVEKVAKEGGDKYKFTVGRGKLSAVVDHLKSHFAEFGELPVPGDFPKSMRVALEAVEHGLREEAKSWEPLLTGKKEPVTTDGTNPAKGSSKEATGTQVKAGIKTLSSGLASPNRPVNRPVPKSPEEYQREALEALSKEIRD